MKSMFHSYTKAEIVYEIASVEGNNKNTRIF